MKTIKVEIRKETGKGPSHQLRLQGLIPAVFYGPGRGALSLKVHPSDVISAISGIYGRNQLVELVFPEGRKELAVVRDVSFDRLSRKLLHADFYSVALGRPIRTSVPFQVTGRAKGVIEGGTIQKVYHELPIVGPPEAIPPAISVDVTGLGINQSIQVKDLSLPQGVRVGLPPEQTLVAVTSKEKEASAEQQGAEGAQAQAAPSGASAKAAPTQAKGTTGAKGQEKAKK
ncbi:MAG: 50S ribosomal protein L25 [Sandaracinaceae bacterium]|nr:50S ribosomal protein L25 [Sandaracinaceae bacterium]